MIESSAELGSPAWTAYVDAFSQWRTALQARGEISIEEGWAVYEDMWLAFARSCNQPGRAVALERIGTDDLERFIRSRGSRSGDAPTPRYVWRLLHLIDRVLTYAARQRQRPVPTVALDLLASRREWRYANARRSESIDYLAPGPARRLVDYLSQVRPRPGRETPPATWQQVRNATALALQLGAGLAPGEVRELPMGAVVIAGSRTEGLPWKLRVPAGTQSPARDAPVAPWAAHVLRYWLQRRSALNIPGDWLLPSTKSGKPWSKQAAHVALVEVLTSAGWSAEEIRGGAFRLRHTFALRQLRKGFDERQVARWLGVEPDAMLRYRGVLLEPVLDLA